MSHLKHPVLLLFLVAGIFAVTTSTGAAAAGPPTGLTAMPISGQVQLAWQPVSGATSYVVMRGTSASTITTVVNPGTTGTTFTDTGLTNNTTYYYAVRSVSSGTQSANSNVLHVKPVSASCSTGNAVHRENCFPGSSAWHLNGGGKASNGGIEGYATATSIQKGGSIGLKTDSGDNAPYHIEIWRSGYYGGTGARLYSVLDGLRGVAQPACQTTSSTGLISCSNWSVAATVSTTSSWPSGVYIARFVREDTGDDSETVFVVRDDASSSAVLYGIDFATYQAYNNYGGKSLYDYNSSGATTAAGTARAVKVSYDRPFNQALTGERDFYPWTDYPYVFWLERMGYDVSYTSNTDLDTAGSQALGHKAYISGAHDEYWSANMRTALTNARNSGVGLFIGGANAIYWKIRFEADPTTGTANRVQVCYKSTQSGGADPGHPDRHVARSGRREPAGERADRPDVRRRQRQCDVPDGRQRRAGRRPHLALHGARHPGARRGHVASRNPRLGVGLARVQRQRAVWRDHPRELTGLGRACAAQRPRLHQRYGAVHGHEVHRTKWRAGVLHRDELLDARPCE
jgi:hypothetical protein